MAGAVGKTLQEMLSASDPSGTAPPVDPLIFLFIALAIAIVLGAVGAWVLLSAGRRPRNELPKNGPPDMPPAKVSLITPAQTEHLRMVVEKGLNYLLDSTTTDKAFKVFAHLLSGGTRGLLVTHIHPKKLMKWHQFKNAEIFWLSEITENVPSFDPGKMDYELTEKVLSFIKEHKSNGVVMLDGMDVLTQMHGFDKVVDFIRSINGVASVNESTVMVAVNSRAMREVEFNQLKSKFDRS